MRVATIIKINGEKNILNSSSAKTVKCHIKHVVIETIRSREKLELKWLEKVEDDLNKISEQVPDTQGRVC